MPEIKRILVVLDPASEQQPALERAAWLATLSGAALDLFICDYDQYLAGEQGFDSDSLAKARQNLISRHLATLKERARRLDKQGIETAVDARWDHPLHEGVARKVAEARPDIVFKDTHYHAALRRSVFSNTDWNLIRCCTAPLWLVKPRAMSGQPRIVAAVDPLHEHDKPAELDQGIVEIAATLRSAVGGELHLIHAYEIAPAVAVSADSMTMPISMPLGGIAEQLKKAHRDAMFALADRNALAHGQVHLQEGPPRRVLVRLTEQMNADVVVLGAVARSGLRRLFLGSTAEQILDRLPCDMLIIKPAYRANDRRRVSPMAGSRSRA
jgi:universal stress protein E